MKSKLILLIICSISFNLLGQKNDGLSEDDLKKHKEQVEAFDEVFRGHFKTEKIEIDKLLSVFKDHQSLLIGEVSDIGKLQSLYTFCDYVELNPQKAKILPDFLKVIKSIEPPKDYGKSYSWHIREEYRSRCGAIGRLILTAIIIDDKKTFSELYEYFKSQKQYDKIDVLLLQLRRLDNYNFKDLLLNELNKDLDQKLSIIIKTYLNKE